MQVEGADERRIIQYSLDTFLYVLPTLPMFMVFASITPHFGFWLALLISMALGTLLVFLLRHLLSLAGYQLW